MNEQRPTSAEHDEMTEEDRPQPAQEVVDPREADPSPSGPNVQISGARGLHEDHADES